MANNKIKGLTVEIGGDTTKLGKALQEIENKSKSLSGELGQVNRLLKVDPENTDLIAQKQQILSEAVANTAKKLETLKAAEKQVQAQFERGEVSADQVRELRREIIATEQKLGGYERAAQETADAIEQLGDGADGISDIGKKASAWEICPTRRKMPAKAWVRPALRQALLLAIWPARRSGKSSTG